jgi:UV DNA damage endonuclease
MRFGLCCLFKAEEIRFRTTTARILSALSRQAQLAKISAICLANAHSLYQAVQAVDRLGIGAFRISSPLLPRMTHPEVGYDLEDLADGSAISALFATTKEFAAFRGIRLSLHPDQFVVLSSPRPEVVANSLRELEYHGFLAAAVGAEVINIHGGGVYGDKRLALENFARAFAELSLQVSGRLTLENDDVSYTVADLLPLCEKLAIPLVYDVHHHRCNPDGLAEQEATRLAAATWRGRNQEQYCHLSSPRNGWGKGDPKPHADYIDVADFPPCWFGLEMTVDIEAKAKELAVIKLMGELN